MSLSTGRPALACVVGAIACGVAQRANADGPEAFARVVVDSAEVRSGAGISFRAIETASRGETLAIEGRPGTDFWLRIRLPDGRAGYMLGDEVQVFGVSPDAPGAPSRPGIFAPPPLEGSHAGLALVGGILSIPIRSGSTGHFGYVEARPAWVIHPTVTLDGFVGEALTADGSQVLYGAGLAVNLAPRWPLCPFLGIGGGGLSVRPNADSFVLRREDLTLARAGGGLLMALRGRILIRLEATNLTLFNAESAKSAQTYSGGLGVYF